MAKLYFRYGTVGSAKSLNLLAVSHKYRQQGKKPLLLKPAVDTRSGELIIKSRTGLKEQVDLVINDDTVLDPEFFSGADCVLVDEAQFLSAAVIEQLRDIATLKNVPVICYGLRTDFRSRLFEGARRLMELADSIEEIKTTCMYCNRKAVLNLKHVNGKATNQGPSIELGMEEKYYPVCHNCYHEKLSLSGDSGSASDESFLKAV